MLAVAVLLYSYPVLSGILNQPSFNKQMPISHNVAHQLSILLSRADVVIARVFIGKLIYIGIERSIKDDYTFLAEAFKELVSLLVARRYLQGVKHLNDAHFKQCTIINCFLGRHIECQSEKN